MIQDTKHVKNIYLTEAIKNNQLIGKALADKFGKNIPYSISLSDGPLSIEDIKKSYQTLHSLEKSYEPLKREYDNSPTDSTIEYLINGGSAMLSLCRIELKKNGILKSFTKDISDSETNEEQQLPNLKIEVVKSLNEELRQVTYVAMQEGTDLHGDYVSLDEIRKAKESFNRALIAKQKLANLFHLFETSSFDIIESYLMPCDATLNGHFIQKGTWVVTLQINDADLWDGVKNGEFVGVSIGAVASVSPVENT